MVRGLARIVGKRGQENNSYAVYLFFAVLAFSIYLYWFNVSVFMDDVFIYLRVARNIANGAGPVFNAGDAHFPVTSPLWVFLLAFLYKIFQFTGIDIVLLSKTLYILFLSLASWLAFLTFRHRIGNWAILGILPIFFNYITAISTGGEIAVVYFSIFGLLWAYSRKNNLLLTGLFAAAAYLSRGELVLFAIPLGLHYIFIASKEKKKMKDVAVDLGKAVLGFLVVALIWHVYYAIQFHTLFPNTLNTKIVQGKSGMWELYYRFGRKHTLSILNGHFYLLFFLVFGMYYLRFLSFALISYTVIHYYAYKFMTIPHYHWYYYDFFLLIPLFILFGIAAFFIFLKDRIKKREWYIQGEKRFPKLIHIVPLLVAVLVTLAAVLITTRTGRMGDFRTDQRLTRYMQFVDWITPNLEKGDTVLAHEIGIISYYLEDAVIRDLNGIASPDVTVEKINDLGYFVTTYSPRFIFFPTWLPQENPLKYVAVKKGLAVYEKGYENIDNGRCNESIFIFKNIQASRPYIRVLERLRKGAAYYPDSEYEIVKNGRFFVLSAPAPFSSSLKIGENITGVNISFGFSPQSVQQAQVKGGGATFNIYGTDNRDRRLLFQRHLLPPGNNFDRHRARAHVSFQGKGFKTLEFIIETKKKTKSKTFWGPIRFIRK